jgi:hypothetical protein
MADRPNLTAALADAAYTLDGMAAAAARAAVEVRTVRAWNRQAGGDGRGDARGDYDDRIQRHEADAARYRLGAAVARRGRLLTGRANLGDPDWMRRFGPLMSRCHDERRTVDPDLGAVDLDASTRGPVT